VFFLDTLRSGSALRRLSNPNHPTKSVPPNLLYVKFRDSSVLDLQGPEASDDLRRAGSKRDYGRSLLSVVQNAYHKRQRMVKKQKC